MPRQPDWLKRRQGWLVFTLVMLVSSVWAEEATDGTADNQARIVRALENPVPLYVDPDGAQQTAEQEMKKGESWAILEMKGDFARIELEGGSYWVDTGDVVLDRKVNTRCAPSPNTVVVAGQMGAGNEECNK